LPANRQRFARESGRHVECPYGVAGKASALGAGSDVPESTYYILVGGSNGDGAWRGLVTTVELIDPRPYKFQVTVYGNLIYTVICMSDRRLTQANLNPRLPPTPDLRSNYDTAGGAVNDSEPQSIQWQRRGQGPQSSTAVELVRRLFA
jgi:hypothetical protein